MKPYLLFIGILSFCTLASTWTAQDHEIFRLRDELKAHEGDNVTFYSFLGVPSSSSSKEAITKAYKRKSRLLHPDKAIPSLLAKHSASKQQAAKEKSKAQQKPVVKVQQGPSQKEKNQITRDANERYARLTVIAKILQEDGRERYDHFLANGFPRWRGTGYYYARFRPGLGSVLVGMLTVFGGAVHYGAMYISWKRHRDFVERYVAHARQMAWGNQSGIPGLDESSLGAAGAPAIPPELDQDSATPLNRRQKRMQEKESKRKETKSTRSAKSAGISRPVEAEPLSQNPPGPRKKVIAENGKVLIVDSEGNVFLEEQTVEGETHELLLDVSPGPCSGYD